MLKTHRIAKTSTKHFVISTVNTEDAGPETAICDAEHARPVERYNSLQEAEEGHEKWVEWCKKNEKKETVKIKELGYGDFCEPQETTLVKLNNSN